MVGYVIQHARTTHQGHGNLNCAGGPWPLLPSPALLLLMVLLVCASLCAACLQEQHAQEFIRQRFEKRLETLKVGRPAGLAGGSNKSLHTTRQQ